MDSTRLHEGMIVYGSEGEKLGKVVRCDEQTFVIEKGTIFHKEYVARYEDVATVSGEDVRLSRGEEALGELARGAVAEGPLGDAGPTGAIGGQETIPTAPLAAEPEEGQSPRADPGMENARRDGDEAGATVTYGMGEDPGSSQARRNDDFDIDEG